MVSQVRAKQGVGRDHLTQPQGEAVAGDILAEAGVAVAPHLVAASAVTEGDVGEIAEHLLTDAEVEGVGAVVALLAVGIAEVHQ